MAPPSPASSSAVLPLDAEEELYRGVGAPSCLSTVSGGPHAQQTGNRGFRGLIALAVLLWPARAFADVGTPLVWASAFHLFLGNACIGLFEGWILARAFRLPFWRCTFLLVLANYVSAWAGFALLLFLFDRFVTDLYTGLRVTWLLILTSYLLTLLLEWPFVALCFRKAEGWWKASLKGSVLIQSISYVLIFGGYWLLSGKSLYTDLEVVSADRILAPAGVVMFFIASQDGDVHRCELGSGKDTRVFDLNSTNHWDHLELKQSRVNENDWDLVAVPELGRKNATVLLPRISTWDRIPPNMASRTSDYYGWGHAFQVGAATNSSWQFAWAHWPEVGMWGENGSRYFHVAFGTPFGGWTPFRAIHLPDDKVLLQLGGRQICLVDVPNKRIARIRDGYGMLAFDREQIIESLDAAPGRPSNE